MTDKFSKAVKLIRGKESWTAEDWAKALWDNVVRDWEQPESILSDRDPKFTGSSFREVMNECRMVLRLTTAYNPRSGECLGEEQHWAFYPMSISLAIWSTMLSRDPTYLF